jgi:NAD(P)-dependent dehydrogenase (short-subunit alcohol dehydrogenase family)
VFPYPFVEFTMDWERGIVPLEGSFQSEPVNLNKPLDFENLKGKVVLITGGASGFGAAVARKAASNGANIVVGDVNNKLGTELIASLRQTTGNDHHHFIPCNVTSWSSQASFFKQAAGVAPHGGIDIVIANAGISDAKEGAIFENPPDYSKMDNPTEPGITRTLDINLRAVFYTTHLALSYLTSNPGSSSCAVKAKPFVRDRQLILVSSMAGLLPLPMLASYAAAKHGVVGLFRSLRATAARIHGIRVNMINPYFAATTMLGTSGEAIMAGSDMARVDDVVDVMIRFIVDQDIVGRGLVVAPGATDEQTKIVGLEHGGPVWDVYADDFGMSDVFVRRIIALTNLRVKAKGWSGLISDLVVALTKPIMKMLKG